MWQGRAGDRSPYADLAVRCRVDNSQVQVRVLYSSVMGGTRRMRTRMIA